MRLGFRVLPETKAVKEPRRSCELCKGEAALYCEADSAFLCWICDARVHGANFLVARHVRTLACADCGSLEACRSLSGPGGGSEPRRRSICASCDPDCLDRPASPSSSCISSSGSTAAAATATRRRRREDEILAKWGRGLGLRLWRGYVRTAARVIRAYAGTMAAAMPLRVCAAAALWFAIRVEEGRGGHTCERVLRRLEACSGVPARIIVIAEERLGRLAGRDQAGEEGWAECP